MSIAAAAADICQPTAKKKRKEVDLAVNNGSGPSKKKCRYECSAEGCTNKARWKGGVCIKHGANGDRCKFEGCTNQADLISGFCYRHQESLPNNYYYNLQIQQQQLQQQQQQILRMGLTSTMSSLGYRFHPPQWNNNYYYDNSFLSSNWFSHCNFEGCNIVAMHGRFCFAHSASSVAPRAQADSQRGYVQGGGNQNAPTIIIIDDEEAGEKKQASITNRKQKEGVAEQSKTPPSSDTGEYCPDESQHRCAIEDGQNDGSDKSVAAGVANLKDDNEDDTSDMRPQRRIRREGNQKDDEEEGASNVAPTQGGDEGGTPDAMEDGDSWGGDGQNEYSCEGVDDGDVHSEEGKQSHVVPDEIRATANDDEREHEIKKKSDAIAELEEELKSKTTEMDTQLMTTVTSRLEERVAKDAANAKVEEMTKKFEAESGAVAELKEQVATRLVLNASLRNQLERPSKGGVEVKEEELTDDEDFTARLTHKRTDQVLEELQTKNAMIQELLTENKQLKDVALAKNEELKTKNAKIQELQTANEQLKDDVRDKDQEITALKQQLIEMVQNRAEIETSEMI